MEHFVQVVFNRHTACESLNESIFPTQEFYETVSGGTIIKIPLNKDLTEAEADTYAGKLANYMFEEGYENFDIEISVTSKLKESDQEDNLPFDVAEDTYVFMKNDPVFYRKSYYPEMVSLSKQYAKGADVNFESSIAPLVKKGIKEYCKQFDINPRDFQNNHFTTISERIKEDEYEEIKEGNY
jgi:hypothetical protein